MSPRRQAQNGFPLPQLRRSAHRLGVDPFVLLCRAHGLPEPVLEHRFHSVRKWRFDYCWPEAMTAIEREGGIWTGGRHTRGKGYLADCEKYNTAQLLGWLVLRFSPQQLSSGEAVEILKQVLK